MTTVSLTNVGLVPLETIYLSRTTLNRGGNFLIGTILEEHLHLTQGFHDETRGFQDFLIDLVVKLARDADYELRTKPAPRGAVESAPPLTEDIPF